MPPWIRIPPATPSIDLLTAVGGHPLVAQLLVQRGLDTPEKAIPFLNPDLYTPAPPIELTGVAEAGQILHDAFAHDSNFLVWGDFDVDGQTSTALLVTALRTLAGEDHVRFHVPNRFEESHGIRLEKLQEKLATSDIPIDVLITCDTGIAEAEAIAYAKDQGMIVIVTDHHDLPSELQSLTPGEDNIWGLNSTLVGQASVRRADAIVNPKFQAPDDPLRTLPGVGVAYKLVQHLFALAGRPDEESDLLDLVALGIVADVAEQINDARYLLQRGLEKLRETRRAGLIALMAVSRVEPASLTADSIGFQLGPRMNALGRLDDATVSVELLSTRDAVRAGQLAGKLERLNQERRLLTSQTTSAALDMIDRNPSVLDYNALVLNHPAWHAGVVGIVASKLVEEFGKPTVLLLNPPGEAARGSARSVPGIDIGAAISACSHLLLTHGGHPGAAGVSLLAENIPAFRRALSEQVERYRDDTVQIGLTIDAEVAMGELNLALAEDLARLAPFGQGNPTPQLVTYEIEVVDDRRLGRDGIHRRLDVRPVGRPDQSSLPVIWFHGGDVELPSGPIDLVFTLNINEYRGTRSLQLMYVDSRPTRQLEQAVAKAQAKAAIRLFDWRDQSSVPAPLPSLQEANWYAEGTLLGTDGKAVAYSPRLGLVDQPIGRPLVIWSAPPSSAVLQWLVDTGQPTEIYICGRLTADDSLPGLLRAVAGMCKYALERDRRLDIGRMAARLGMTEAVIHQALLWLEARGELAVVEWLAGDLLQVEPGTGTVQTEAMQPIRSKLEESLAEIRAYRRFFQRVRVQELGLAVPA